MEGVHRDDKAQNQYSEDVREDNPGGTTTTETPLWIAMEIIKKSLNSST